MSDRSHWPKDVLAMCSREIEGSTEQLSDGWFKARMGRITGSKLGEVVPARGDKMPARANMYIAEKCLEIVAGFSREVKENDAMRWGRDYEADARAFAEDFLGSRIYEVGSITMEWSDQVSSSPDGIGVDGGGIKFAYESKCPMSHTHIGYLMAGKMPSKYINQVQGHLAATGAEYCIFHSFDPRFPPENQHMILKVDRDDKRIELMKTLTLVAVDKINKGVEAARKNSAEIDPF